MAILANLAQDCDAAVYGMWLSLRPRQGQVKTANWQKAQEFLREWEAKESEPNAPQEPMTIQAAGEKFLGDAEAQKLAEATIYKYRLLFKQMAVFSPHVGARRSPTHASAALPILPATNLNNGRKLKRGSVSASENSDQ